MSDIFKKYIDFRLQNRNASADRIKKQLAEYFEAKIEQMFKKIDIDTISDQQITLITVRKIESNDSFYLRPLFTYPEEHIDTVNRFSRETGYSFSKISDALNGIEAENCKYDEDNNSFTAVHTLRSVEQKELKEPSFVKRIEQAFPTQLLNDKNEDKYKNHICIFSVKTIKQKKKNYRPSHIFALYLRPSSQKENIEEIRKVVSKHICVLSKHMNVLFDELDSFRKLDAELFDLEGSELMTSIQSTFLNQRIAPADKIAFAIEKLKKLLVKHTGQHFLESDNHQPKVYYIPISYERNPEKLNSVLPIMEFYPHAYRKEYSFGAFLVGHSKIPSMVKYLLRHYFKMHAKNTQFVIGRPTNEEDQHNAKIAINESFDKIFSDIDKLKKYADLSKIIFDKDSSDQLFARKAIRGEYEEEFEGQIPDDIWEELNVRVTPNFQAASILAFVIEGDLHSPTKAKNSSKRQLPKAILAIESEEYDMLSHAERNIMRKIASSLAVLIKSISHENSLLNYKNNLSKAYEKFVPYFVQMNKPEYVSRASRFLLASISVDAELLGGIIKKLNNKNSIIDKSTIETAEIFFEKNLEKTQLSDKEAQDDNKRQEVLSTRLSNVIEYIYQSHQNNNLDELMSLKFIDFLEACPKNFVWAGYIPCLAEALADRSNSHLPEFDLIAPGYSASGLYMAIIENEIQQIVKLSSFKKLKKEKDNYREFVRYKLLLAARIPVNGLVFDSLGNIGMEAGKDTQNEDIQNIALDETYEENTYGVLISDLASATLNENNTHDERIIQNFLDRVYDTLLTAHDNLITLNKLIHSIDHLFGVSLSLWRLAKNKEHPLSLVSQTLRLSNRDKVFYKNLLDGNKGANIPYEKDAFPLTNKLEAKKLHNIVDFLEPNVHPNIDEQGMPNMNSVVHGDLNASNLVWAGAIKHFIMIDFEHTRIGVWGTDQIRLMINLVVGLPSLCQIDNNKIFKQIDHTIRWIQQLWNALLNIKTNTLRTCLKIRRENEGQLTSILQSIFRSIYYDINVDSVKEFSAHRFTSKKISRLYRTIITLTILKELEYSIIGVKKSRLSQKQIDEVNKILAPKSTASKELKKIFEIETLKGDLGKVAEQRAAITRYVVIHKLFLKTDGKA